MTAAVSLPQTVTERCPVCGEIRPLSYVFSRKGYAIRRCNTCGLGMTVIDDYDTVKGIYSEDYFNGQQADGYADYVGSSDVLAREFRSVVGEFVRVGAGTGKLLEIGCAYGYFLREAAPYFDAEGIELCEAAVDSCQSSGLRVRQGTLTAAYMQERGPFDQVVLLDVIEHLPDPEDTISLAWEGLRPGGHILVTTGDWDSLLARMMGSRWRLMTPPQHLFFFSARNLSRLLQRIGFEIVSISHPGKVVPLGLVLFQLRRMLGMRPSVRPGANSIGIPINVFDAMRVIARKPAKTSTSHVGWSRRT